MSEMRDEIADEIYVAFMAGPDPHGELLRVEDQGTEDECSYGGMERFLDHTWLGGPVIENTVKRACELAADIALQHLTTELAASRAREAIVRDECTQYDRNCGLTASDLAERIMRELTAPAALSASEDAK